MNRRAPFARLRSRITLMVLCLAGWPVIGFADVLAPAAAAPTAPASAPAAPAAPAGPAVPARPAGGAAAAEAEAEARERIKRFAQVDDRLYRGGQPNAAGFRALRDLGITTIISLRNEDDGDESAEGRLVTSLGMTFINIPVTLHPFGFGGGLPQAAIARFFSIVDNPVHGKVFVHCRRGADRTGTFVGLYRIARQGWDSARAYDEARAIGMRWWHYPVKDHLAEFATSGMATLAAPAAAASPAATSPAATSPAEASPIVGVPAAQAVSGPQTPSSR